MVIMPLLGIPLSNLLGKETFFSPLFDFIWHWLLVNCVARFAKGCAESLWIRPS